MPQKTKQRSIRFPADLHDFLVQDAKKNERSFSRELVFMLKKAIRLSKNAVSSDFAKIKFF